MVMQIAIYNCWEILAEIGTSDILICSLRNQIYLSCVQDAIFPSSHNFCPTHQFFTSLRIGRIMFLGMLFVM